MTLNEAKTIVRDYVADTYTDSDILGWMQSLTDDLKANYSGDIIEGWSEPSSTDTYVPSPWDYMYIHYSLYLYYLLQKDKQSSDNHRTAYAVLLNDWAKYRRRNANV